MVKNLLNLIKRIVKFFIRVKNNSYEYNHKYGNIIRYRKCQWDKHFVKTSKEINLEENYLNFINDLDDESVKVASKELGRVFLINDGFSSRLNLFSKEEETNIEEAYRTITSSILKLNDNCYAFRRYLLPINEFEISTFIYNYGLDCINKAYLTNKCVIDAGAYIGDSSIVFEHELPLVSKIYSFEPSKSTYSLLLDTIKLNKSEKIIPVNVALGEKSTSMPLVGMGMGLTLAENSDTRWKMNREMVNVVSLDDYVSKNNLNVGLIKTDLEGFEQEFLKGAINTIKTYKPTLMISIYHSAQDYFQVKEIIKSLNLGYKFSLFKADDGYLIAGTLLICQVE